MNQKDTQTSDLIGQRKIRIDKLNKLVELGIDPFPAKSNKTHKNVDIVSDFSNLVDHEVTVTGRIISSRSHGKLIFWDIEDVSGKIQIFVRSGEIAETNKVNQTIGFNDLHLIDMSDFVEVTGKVIKTQRGEISILARSVKILVKTLRQLPATLEDKEERFRRRYVDMNVNKEVRERMERRGRYWEAHREFFKQNGFVEVNIPVLEHIPGGGDATPFLTHMNSIDEDFYLRISHELPLKRLIGAGFEKVYDIGPRFRNEGMSDEHLPEHVAMEFYWAYADWKDGMEFVKEMFNHVMNKVYVNQTKFNIRGFEVDFQKDWEIIDFAQIIKDRYKIDVYNTSEKEISGVFKRLNLSIDFQLNVPRGIDYLWKQIRKTVAGPAFLVNHPKYLSPLQKPSLENPMMVERFQPIIAGSELGNGWSELNDPIDQYNRFKEQQELRDAGDGEAQWLDIDYVEMLEYGMPPTFGYGHAERNFWFMEDVTAREGVPFPQMKFHVDEISKKIYSDINFDEIMINRRQKKEKLNEDKSIIDIELPTREEAMIWLNEHVKDEYQIKHAQMVASAMEAWALKLVASPSLSGEGRGEVDPELWYLTGLLHDIDYFEYPEEHPKISLDWLRQWNLPEELVHAVEAHAFQRTGVEPQSKLASALIACDELSGFLYAYSLMRPEGFNGMEYKGVKKRLKDKNFAAKIDRSDIEYGVEKFGVDMQEHVQLLIETFLERF